MRTRGAVAPCNRHMELISQLADDARYHPRSSAHTRTHQRSKSSELLACVLQFRINIKMEKIVRLCVRDLSTAFNSKIILVFLELFYPFYYADLRHAALSYYHINICII